MTSSVYIYILSVYPNIKFYLIFFLIQSHIYIYIYGITTFLDCLANCQNIVLLHPLYCIHKQNETKPHGLRMRGLNFLLHHYKVEVYALILGHILFNSTLGRKTAFIATHPLRSKLKIRRWLTLKR